LSYVTASGVKVGSDTKVGNAPGFVAAVFGETIEFIRQHGPKLGWGLLSVALFAGLCVNSLAM